MKNININGIDYEVKEEINSALENAELEEKITDYFTEFDYIVGDWAYGKLRLKGFNSKKNKNFRSINDISSLDDYIKTFCAYGCKWFLLEKVNNSLEK